MLVACGNGLNGTYAYPDGIGQYKFESGGKVTEKTKFAELEMKYEVEGKKVKVFLMGEVAMILTVQDDGSLLGPTGLKLKKVP